MLLVVFRSRLVAACLLAVMLGAQIPAVLTVCLNAEDGVRVGYGCQCLQCSTKSSHILMEAQGTPEKACPCGDLLCRDTTQDDPVSVISSGTSCCEVIGLPFHLAAIYRQAPQPRESQWRLRPASAPRILIRLADGLSSVRLAELSRPPGRTPFVLLKKTVLLI